VKEYVPIKLRTHPHHGLAPVHVVMDIVTVYRAELSLELLKFLFELDNTITVDKFSKLFAVIVLSKILGRFEILNPCRGILRTLA
jgi:hypothetical protein